MNKKISDKDKKDWENFIRKNEKLENKDKEFFTAKFEKNKIIDLHGYTIRNANLTIKDLLINSYNRGVRKITVITGKGMRSKNIENPYKSLDLSILKYSVPEYIKNNLELMSKIKKIDLEAVNNKNSGEFIIYLKNKK